MGISRGAIKLIAMAVESDRSPGPRAAITFGVQGVQASYDEAVAALRAAGAAPAAIAQHDIRHDAVTQFGKTIHQTTLFRLLNYDATDSIDVFPNEQPTYVEDLNRPLPHHLNGRYALVYDGGTMEHCFNPPQVMMNAVALTQVGGRVIHHVPMNNWVDHGFYQFSPTLFFDFYAANGFADFDLKIHFIAGGRESFISYALGADERLPYALGRKACVLAFFTARKTVDVPQIVYPIQGRYRQTFGDAGAINAAKTSKSAVARLRRSWRKRTIQLRATTL